MIKCTIFIIALFLSGHSVYAADVRETSVIDSDEALITLKAQQFNITEEEWKKYRSIMDGEGKYHWINVPPIVILGIYAENAEDRKRFAKKAVVREYELQRMFIEFNRAFAQAFKDLYGDEKIIDLSSTPLFRNVKSQALVNINNNDSAGDRYILFVSTTCYECESFFHSIRKNQKIGTVIDLYFVNDSKSEIGRWAQRLNIRTQDVSSGNITLNIDNGMHASYQHPPLPSAFYFDEQTQSVERFQ